MLKVKEEKYYQKEQNRILKDLKNILIIQKFEDFSKTDSDAIFMKMKEDHMRNAQRSFYSIKEDMKLHKLKVRGKERDRTILYSL